CDAPRSGWDGRRGGYAPARRAWWARPWWSGSDWWSRSLGNLLDLERYGLLRGVRVLRAGVHLEFADELPAQPVVGQYALHRKLDGALGSLGEQLLVPDGAQPARVAGVPVGHLGLPLVAGQGHLRRVDHDDEVAGVHVRCEGRLVLAAQERRGL